MGLKGKYKRKTQSPLEKNNNVNCYPKLAVLAILDGISSLDEMRSVFAAVMVGKGGQTVRGKAEWGDGVEHRSLGNVVILFL